mmetsp:Transcript_27676/g.49471  ORF Transcript_27676/g.49471 Transcript_27676/m.49471 type:complete len:226 (+) Transcript_27676:97-774(+)
MGCGAAAGRRVSVSEEPTPLFGINDCGASQSGIQCTAEPKARVVKFSRSQSPPPIGINDCGAFQPGIQCTAVPVPRATREHPSARQCQQSAFKSSLDPARVSTGLQGMAPTAGSSIASDGGEQPGSVPAEEPGQEDENDEQELLDSLRDDLAYREVSFSEDQLIPFDSFSARYRRADFPSGHQPPSNGISHDRWIQRLEAWLEPLSTNPAALEEHVALFRRCSTA